MESWLEGKNYDRNGCISNRYNCSLDMNQASIRLSVLQKAILPLPENPKNTGALTELRLPLRPTWAQKPILVSIMGLCLYNATLVFFRFECRVCSLKGKREGKKLKTDSGLNCSSYLWYKVTHFCDSRR